MKSPSALPATALSADWGLKFWSSCAVAVAVAVALLLGPAFAAASRQTAKTSLEPDSFASYRAVPFNALTPKE